MISLECFDVNIGMNGMFCLFTQNDVICLPLKLSRSLANIGQIVICNRVTTAVQLINPQSLQGDLASHTHTHTYTHTHTLTQTHAHTHTHTHTHILGADLSSSAYSRTPFLSLCHYRQLTEFYILHIEPLEKRPMGASVTNLSDKVAE